MLASNLVCMECLNELLEICLKENFKYISEVLQNKKKKHLCVFIYSQIIKY